MDFYSASTIYIFNHVYSMFTLILLQIDQILFDAFDPIIYW